MSAIAKAAGVSQASLHAFVHGRADGSFADLRFSTVAKLLSLLGAEVQFRPSPPQHKGDRMLLATELRVHGVASDPREFKSLLLQVLSRDYPGYTIDNLCCEPEKSRQYAATIRNEVTADADLPDPVILKALMNMRRAKEAPVSGITSRANLQKELTAAGCGLAPAEFRQLAADCLADMYKGQTIDAVLCHPNEATELARYIRRRAECEAIPISLALRTALNNRKDP